MIAGLYGSGFSRTIVLANGNASGVHPAGGFERDPGGTAETSSTVTRMAAVGDPLPCQPYSVRVAVPNGGTQSSTVSAGLSVKNCANDATASGASTVNLNRRM